MKALPELEVSGSVAVSVIDRVLTTMFRYNMLRPGDRVVAAVSGGPDSVSSCQCFAKLLRAWVRTVTGSRAPESQTARRGFGRRRAVRRRAGGAARRPVLSRRGEDWRSRRESGTGRARRARLSKFFSRA